MTARGPAWAPLKDVGGRLTPRVSYQAVQSWIKDGFSGHRVIGGVTHVHVPSLIAWRAQFKTDPDAPGHGGRRAGAGRKKGGPAEPRRSAGHDAATRPLPLSEAEIRRRAAAGTIGRAEIALALDTIKALDAIQAAAVAQGRLLDAEACAAAWGELLQAHKDELDELPGRVEARAAADLSLAPADARALREIIAEEVAAAVRDLLTRDWKPSPRKAGRP